MRVEPCVRKPLRTVACGVVMVHTGCYRSMEEGQLSILTGFGAKEKFTKQGLLEWGFEE